MPHLITNPESRESHPLYKNKKSMGHSLTSKAHAEMSEKTTAIPKTYDAIKSAADADMKVKGTNQVSLRKK